jgi:hypothetical protein
MALLVSERAVCLAWWGGVDEVEGSQVYRGLRGIPQDEGEWVVGLRAIVDAYDLIETCSVISHGSSTSTTEQVEQSHFLKW